MGDFAGTLHYKKVAAKRVRRGVRQATTDKNPEPVHERWCVRINDKVKYAYEILMDPDSLLESDRRWLAALKTKWGANQ